MLSRSSAILVVVDIQGNLFQAMQDKENLLAQAIKIIKGANVFNLPIIVTEQTPAKLGQTVEQIMQELKGSEVIGKETFSSWADNNFREKMESYGRQKVVLIGIESHVCIYQTAIDLIQNGYSVHVVTDAVSSRTRENSDVGLAAMKAAGAHMTSAEMVLFELLRTAGDAKFKEIYKIVK
jgi:nicotinamidase-related amidase